MRGVLVYTSPQGDGELIVNDTNSDQKVRVAVGSEHGPRSAVWSFIGKREGDVYLGERETMSMVKISLHESGKRRLAYDEKYARAKLPDDLDRKLAEWSPTEIAPGWRSELEIWIRSQDVNTVAKVEGKPSSVRNIHWVPVPPPGSATVLVLVTCQRGHPDYQKLEINIPNLQPVAGLFLKRRAGIELGVIYSTVVELHSELSEHLHALGTDLRQHDLEMRQRLHAEGRRSVLLDLTELPPRFIDQSII